MTNIEALKARRAELDAAILATRQELEKETAAKRIQAVEQCKALVQEFSLKPYELTGGKIPGRKAKSAPILVQTQTQPENTPADFQNTQPQAHQSDEAPDDAPMQETKPSKPAKGLRVIKSGKNKPNGEAAAL